MSITALTQKALVYLRVLTTFEHLRGVWIRRIVTKVFHVEALLNKL